VDARDKRGHDDSESMSVIYQSVLISGQPPSFSGRNA
jgi:hypothetical protein